MPIRSRAQYGLRALLTVLLGLASRRFGADLPGWVMLYAGDALWALLVFWLLRGAQPRWTLMRAATLAVGIAYAVEVSQRYHAPWLDALRGTTLGGLVLGHGFLWSDLLCYTFGIALGAGLEWMRQRGAV
ncbi:DUF2809 domain-containing protein [Hymenobacter sp. 102]|uniref:ribosomal maturation YjgA family protein n=1 Tax=Hymenobacter sp. 102 TaxID=3403152 RepID=UPI003CF94BAE